MMINIIFDDIKMPQNMRDVLQTAYEKLKSGLSDPASMLISKNMISNGHIDTNILTVHLYVSDADFPKAIDLTEDYVTGSVHIWVFKKSDEEMEEGVSFDF